MASEARSEPAPGSLKSCAHCSSPVTMRGRNRRLVASSENARIAGAASTNPDPRGTCGTFQRSSSSYTAPASASSRPRPPCSTGQWGATHPAAPSRAITPRASRPPRIRRSVPSSPASAASAHPSGRISTRNRTRSSVGKLLTGVQRVTINRLNNTTLSERNPAMRRRWPVRSGSSVAATETAIDRSRICVTVDVLVSSGRRDELL